MLLARNSSWQELVLLFAALFLVAGCDEKIHRQGEQSMITGYVKVEPNGHLAPCPNKPNCVNSEQALGRASIVPFQVYGSVATSWQKLLLAVQKEGGTMESVSNTFLHATFRSRIFRFVDDVTCRLDSENNVIHIRSASRIGYSDFGANRRRMERIRASYKSLLDINS